MKNSLVILFLCFTTLVFSQQKDKKELEREARENIREGNELYNQFKFKEAEIAYKKGLSKNPNYPIASYNLGNSIYQQDRNKEAVSQFELVEKTFKEKISKAEAYHNMGNAFMKEKQYEKAVEALKNSMRNNSKDDETRYNLALAQELLKKQQQENKDNKENQDNKDNKDDKNKDQKDKEGGDKEKKDDENKEKDKGKDKEDDKGDKKKDKNDQQKEDKKKDQKPRPNQLTPEQIKQLLDAMNNEENKTQKKLNAKKAKGKKIKQEKDW
ncbi:MAG: DNA primase [Lutibacter sp.]|nr:MAG: DNA primase [Lutibacter sp.]